MALARGEEHNKGFASALGTYVDLSAESPLAASQGFIASLSAGACRILMRADDGTVDKVETPVELAGGIGLPLELF